MSEDGKSESNFFLVIVFVVIVFIGFAFANVDKLGDIESTKESYEGIPKIEPATIPKIEPATIPKIEPATIPIITLP